MNLSKWASEYALDIWIECVENGDDVSDRVWEVADGAFCYHNDTISIWSTYGDHDDLSDMCEPSHDIGNLLMTNAVLHARDALYIALEDLPDPSRVAELVEECCDLCYEELPEGDIPPQKTPCWVFERVLDNLGMENNLDKRTRDRLIAKVDSVWLFAYSRYL